MSFILWLQQASTKTLSLIIYWWIKGVRLETRQEKLLIDIKIQCPQNLINIGTGEWKSERGELQRERERERERERWERGGIVTVCDRWFSSITGASGGLGPWLDKNTRGSVLSKCSRYALHTDMPPFARGNNAEFLQDSAVSFRVRLSSPRICRCALY